MPGEKPKDFKASISKLIAYSGKYLWALGVSLVFAFVGSVLTIIGPDYIKKMTALIQEGIMGEMDLAAIGKVGWILVLIYAVSALFSYGQAFIMATVTQIISKNLRRDISAKINLLPLKYFDSTTLGDILSRVTNDVDTIGHTLNQSASQLVSSITLFIGSLIMMFITDYRMALAAIISSLFGFFLMSLIMSNSQKFFVRQQKYLGQINGHVEESYAGHNILKAYNAEEIVCNEFDSINESLRKSTFWAQFLSGLMQPIMGFVGNLGYVVVCVFGAYLTTQKGMDFAVIVAFMMYIRFFTQPLSQIAQATTSLQSTAASAERVFEFLGEESMEDESDKTEVLDPSKVLGEIEFKNVKFGYDPDKIIIKNFSAVAHPGQKIAIVGPTGAGKTTLVNLLMRFYELNGGEILIDHTPTNLLTRENIHDLFGMVLQDTWLFEGTIRENLIYGKTGITDEQLDRATKAAGIHHFIRTLPKGYDTVLNDQVSLSAGQKQLLTIARAMIEDAPMLILDEATSSVDTRTELMIQKAMDRLMKGRTSFVIAHRLSTIKNADLILVLKDGDVIESGTHEELLRCGGFYAELYNSQFEKVS
ncbi:MAG: ABC transporter ATP-binding protein [Lachnospiraceae bacterium]|nr:ABC transporter ATP-binding protein [Lachnospiraceae bacterium]